MKKLLLLLPLGLLFNACSNDFEVTAPWKDIPVVYGILAPLDPTLYPQDTAHYIRIEKAFIDPDRSALEIAQIADSLYYPENSITVWLERKDNNTRFQLHRVDGALEGYPRDQGVFAGQPNWLYKLVPPIGFALEAGQTYKLIIERNDNLPDVTAETTLPGQFTIIRPLVSSIAPKIAFAGSALTAITWRTDDNGVFFNVTIKVRINERNLNGSLVSTQELVWEAAKNIERDPDLIGTAQYEGTVSLSGISFYNFLAKHLQRPAPNRYREFKDCDIILEGGGKEIKEYLETANANSGLTGAETFPNYTNISEGYGIFTAKNRTVGQAIGFEGITVDSMNRSSITDTLGFYK